MANHNFNLEQVGAVFTGRFTDQFEMPQEVETDDHSNLRWIYYRHFREYLPGEARSAIWQALQYTRGAVIFHLH